MGGAEVDLRSTRAGRGDVGNLFLRKGRRRVGMEKGWSER